MILVFLVLALNLGILEQMRGDFTECIFGENYMTFGISFEVVTIIVNGGFELGNNSKDLHDFWNTTQSIDTKISKSN